MNGTAANGKHSAERERRRGKREEAQGHISKPLKQRHVTPNLTRNRNAASSIFKFICSYEEKVPYLQYGKFSLSLSIKYIPIAK